MIWLKEQLSGTVILAVLMLVFAVFFQSFETGLFFVASLGFHEMGHLIPIRWLRIPGYLTVMVMGIATVSDAEGRSKLTEYQNSLIHLGGPFFNLILVLVCLMMHYFFGPADGYWLRLVNVNALIGFINILVLDHASDGGKYIARLFASLPETLDDVLVFAFSMLSVLILAGLAIWTGPQSYIWIGFVAAWVVMSMWRAEREDDKAVLPRKPMDRYQVAISLTLYVLMFVVFVLALIATPFLITDTQAYDMAMAFGRTIVFFWLNLPMLLGSLLIFLSITIPHELGHLIAARFVGIGIKRFVIGHPSGNPVLKFNLGLPWEIYRLPVLAAVDSDDESMMKSSLSSMTLFALAGPLVNLALALFVTMIFAGFFGGLSFLWTNLWVSVQLIMSVLFGWTGQFGGSGYFFTSYDAINAQVALLNLPDWVGWFALSHVFVAVVNLLPIPGLDGGWILMSLVTKITNRNKSEQDTQANTVAIYNSWVEFATKRLMQSIVLTMTLALSLHLIFAFV